MSHQLHQLHNHPLFQIRSELLSPDESIALSYKRARLLFKAHGWCSLTVQDIQYCGPRFWAMLRHPLCATDIAMFTVLVCQTSLAIGTLSRHLKKRPDLKPLVNRLMRFETIGIYLLTERGHGLDAFNVETTATKTPDGFILNTPKEEAAKFMPGSSPRIGIPKIALAMAQLIVNGENRGTRFFVVPICNEREMYQGVESVALPPRSGTQPFDWSITRFKNVHLPPTALVGSDIDDFRRPPNPLQSWWDEIWRIPIGTLVVAAPWISAIKATAFIGGQYSMHRCILGRGNEPTPILSFRTQQWPILNTTATAMVLENWYPVAIDATVDRSTEHNIRHALAVIAKTTICRYFQRCVPEVAERCGAQGTFEHNYMAKIENDGKGAIIAEGDILTLCIRLFSELLLKRYEVPLPPPEESLLAHHAVALLEENIQLFAALKCDHRSDSFNNLLLPQAQPVIEAMGHALAYSAALKGGLPQYVLDVYEASVIRQDPAWYSECAGINRLTQRLREDAAVSSMLPHLSALLSQLNIEQYVTAPIVTDAQWKAYLSQLPVLSGNAVPVPEQFHAML
ncbi:Peroxisomal acyl-coenzyme A oxidase 3 [Leucoagaricus sp. SymC.cos]|nr:Peroxisomal acyl-coenzyme A oxidase 3 [Leucoagaricus sp. SymC.cos]